MTEDPETTIDVEPDSDRDTETWTPLPTVDTGPTRTASPGFPRPAGTPVATAWRHEDRLPQSDGGHLHVIVAAARTPGVGAVAAYEGTDGPGQPLQDLTRGLADGMAVRVVTRLDKHQVAVPGEDGKIPLGLRYIPAAAVTNPRVNLGVVLPDDWNAMVGGTAGYTANGLEYEVNTLETLGYRIRHRLYIAATPSSMGVHFGTLAERIDLRATARDVLRAGGTVQIEAGAMTALDACAAVGLAPWSGWVRRFDVTIVVPCGAESVVLLDGSMRHFANIPMLAREAVDANGGSAIEGDRYPNPYSIAIALADAHKVVPGIAGWTTELSGWEDENVPEGDELRVLMSAVSAACDGEVDVDLVTTGGMSVIDLR